MLLAQADHSTALRDWHWVGTLRSESHVPRMALLEAHNTEPFARESGLGSIFAISQVGTSDEHQGHCVMILGEVDGRAAIWAWT